MVPLSPVWVPVPLMAVSSRWMGGRRPGRARAGLSYLTGTTAVGPVPHVNAAGSALPSRVSRSTMSRQFW